MVCTVFLAIVGHQTWSCLPRGHAEGARKPRSIEDAANGCSESHPVHPFWAAEGRFGPIAAFSDLRRAVMTGVSVQAPRGDHNTPFGRLLGAERSQGSQQGLPKRAP